MSTLRFFRAGALGMAAALAAALPAQAARHKTHKPAPAASTPATESLGKSGAWTAYASGDKANRVCYLVGQPQKSEPAGTARKSPMAMVTHRPAEKIANVVSFVEGYPLKEGSEVSLDVDGRKFALFTKDDSAWARTSELDRTIVATLEKSRQVVVKGTSEKGSATTDTYSLAGFSKALELIDKACGVKREGSAAPVPAAPASHPAAKQHHKSRRRHSGHPAPR